MALSNWDTMAIALDGDPQAGFYVSPAGVRVEIYKNWVYVYDEKGWTEKGRFTKPCVMGMQYGKVEYKDVEIQLVRGPQNGVYGACWHHDWEAEQYLGFVGCGVSGFEGEEWVGVKPSSVEFLRLILSHDVATYTEDEIDEWMTQVYHGDGVDKEWRSKCEQDLRESRTFDFPEEIAQVALDKGVRFNQGDMFFAERGVGPLAATKPGEAEEPILIQAFKTEEKAKE